MSRVTYYPELAQRVRSQRDLQPDLYGDFDFDVQPDRLATEPDVDSALPTWVADRAPILEDDRIVELMSTATLLGDVVADPYAALMATHSVTQLIDMLKRACREGIESVPDAPPELAAFIGAMEAAPEWIDFDLVREGARQERIPAALLAPFITRGAFIATFTNTYAALPMALTGALYAVLAAPGRASAGRASSRRATWRRSSRRSRPRWHRPGGKRPLRVSGSARSRASLRRRRSSNPRGPSGAISCFHPRCGRIASGRRAASPRPRTTRTTRLFPKPPMHRRPALRTPGREPSVCAHPRRWRSGGQPGRHLLWPKAGRVRRPRSDPRRPQRRARSRRHLRSR